MFVFIVIKVKDYDYYGAYDTQKNMNYKYNTLLGREYTFDFPPHHDVVRRQAYKCVLFSGTMLAKCINNYCMGQKTNKKKLRVTQMSVNTP